ncbi:MAG: 3-dehydroquinate synthase [Verrucomicrobiota bacterium]
MTSTLKSLELSTESNTYQIIIESGLTLSDDVPDVIKDVLSDRNILVVSDDNVSDLYIEQIKKFLLQAGAAKCHITSFPAGEQSKNLQTISSLYQEALNARVDRHSLIVALGGGVVGDVAGFVAATYLRGIDFVQIPTTLLAMVDSSVGGKVGVDLPEGKNLVGAFYQPSLVVIDVNLLQTLPLRELRCGLAEVVKYGMIMDAGFFKQLEETVNELIKYDPSTYRDVIEHCCRLKAEVVQADEKELTGRRAILNYGHTFGHALEALMSYSGLTHGEGVAIGMGMAADLAVLTGLTEKTTAARQDALLQALELPTQWRGEKVEPEKVYSYMFHDKKTVSSRLRLILPQRIGQVEIIEDAPQEKIIQAIGGRCG